MEALRLVTLGVTALVAIAASLGLFYTLGQAHGEWGPGVVLVWLGAAALVVTGGIRWARRGAPTPVLGVTAAALVFLALSRLVAVLAIDAPLVSDFKDYHDMARGYISGAPWLGEGRPPGWPLMLAAAYDVAGLEPRNGEWLNLVFAIVSGGLLWALVRALAGAAAAALAVAAFACWPAHLLMTPVLGTEVAYCCLFLAAMAALARVSPLIGPPPPGAQAIWAAIAGSLLGWAQYVRPTTLALLPAALAYLLAVGRGTAQRLALAALCLAVTLAVLAPVAAWSLRTRGELALAPSSYGGWSLLVGMGQTWHGRWNREDEIRYESFGDRRKAEAWAREEGLRRMVADPAATARLVVQKFEIMWGMEDYGTYWALGTRPGTDARNLTLVTLVAQSWWVLVTWLAAIALWRRRDWTRAWLPLWLGLSTLVAVHAVLEVQGRYHFYWVPLFIALAAANRAESDRERNRIL